MMSEIENYLQAIFDQVYDKSELDQMVYDINLLKDKLNYKSVSENGGENFEAKKQQINFGIESVESPKLKRHLINLLEQNNLWLFEPSHIKAFAEEFSARVLKTIFIQLTSAVKLSDEDFKGLADRLSSESQRKVLIEIRVDESLIGGAIIKKDNYILDYSIKTKLDNFSARWKESIQNTTKAK